MIEESLFSYVTGVAGVAALIGTRFYPNEVPAKAPLPFVRAKRVGGPREHTIGGPTGMARAAYDLESNAKTYLGAKAVKEQLRLALDGYDLSRGPMGTPATTVHSVEVQDEEDDYNDVRKADIVRLPILIWYTEEVGP